MLTKTYRTELHARAHAFASTYKVPMTVAVDLLTTEAEAAVNSVNTEDRQELREHHKRMHEMWDRVARGLEKMLPGD